MTTLMEAATALLVAAKALATHPDTPQLLADWSPGVRAASLEVRVSGGGDHSDPVGGSAIDGLTSLHAEWVEALAELAKITNETFGAQARYVPSTVTMLTTLARSCRSIPKARLKATVTHAATINRLVGRSHPVTVEQADTAQREGAALAVETSYCWVCETPGPGFCEPCRKLLDYHTQAGHVHLVDPGAFRSHVHDGIIERRIDRPASPYTPIGAVRIHAPTRFVCTNCQHPQNVIGLATMVRCPECGSECREAA